MKSLKLPKQRTIQLPAGLFRRTLAFIVDLFIINLVIVSPFRKKLMSLIPEANYMDTYSFIMENPTVTHSIYQIFIIMILLTFLYYVIFEWKLSQTPGKMLLKIFTISENKTLTFWQSVVRNLDVLTPLLFFPIILFDLGYAIFNNEKKRFLEKLSKTKSIMKVIA